MIPPGVDLAQFTVGDGDHELPRILFVGGDFVRREILLLDVFRKRLRGKAELLLVTKDPVPEEAGVRVFRDVQANSEQLLDLFRTSDTLRATDPSRLLFPSLYGSAGPARSWSPPGWA